MRACALTAVLWCLSLSSVAVQSADTEPVGSPRPENWAQPVEVAGVGNLFKVSDDLYRSAQPKPEGMRSLDALGVKTIVSVRFFHSGRRPLDNTDLIFQRIAMMPWHPKKKEVVRFLRIVTDPDQTPVLLHCYKGADRTGMLSALYRIVVQGWSKEDAIEEMRQGGYGFNSLWNNLIRWVEKADIEGLRTEVGIPTLPNGDRASDPVSGWRSLCDRWVVPIVAPRLWP